LVVNIKKKLGENPQCCLNMFDYPFSFG
jgi:hypothetical protein